LTAEVGNTKSADADVDVTGDGADELHDSWQDGAEEDEEVSDACVCS
jgi:hypothetical protein